MGFCFRIARAVLPLLLAQAVMAQSWAQGTLRIAMTAGDVPTTTGAPTQGLEGTRFAGYPVFEPLCMWDLRQTDKPPSVIPWLATSWTTDPADRTKWIFTLRQGVTFHDGSPFTADAVVFNLARFFDKTSPQFDPAGAATNASRSPFIGKWEKIDDMTVAIYTKTPTTYFPEIVAGILIASPAQYEKSGKTWQAFGAHPSGTGAFRITVGRSAPRSRWRRTRAYWNTERAAKLDQAWCCFRCPESDHAARRLAVRTGRLDRGAAAGRDTRPGDPGGLHGRHQRRFRRCGPTG